MRTFAKDDRINRYALLVAGEKAGRYAEDGSR